jgi:hypothetical protein
MSRALHLAFPSTTLTVFGVAACATAGALGAAPAIATTTVDCGPAQEGSVISVVGGNCQAVYSAAGEYTFTLPADVTIADAIIVGAGGGATEISANGNGYGGGGGEVTFIDLVNPAVATAVTVGEGGAGANAEGGNGGATSFGDTTANGGEGGLAGSHSGASGRGIYSSDYFVGNGSIDDGEGVGYLPSDLELVGSSTLFPAIESELELGRGGRYEVTPAEIGFGWGGSSWAQTAQPGSDGAVIVRWTPGSLASTGAETTNIIATGLALTVIGGLTRISTRRRITH